MKEQDAAKLIISLTQKLQLTTEDTEKHIDNKKNTICFSLFPLCTLLCEAFVKYPTDKAKSTQRKTSKIKELFHYLFFLCVPCGFINVLLGLIISGMLTIIPDNAQAQTIRHVHPHNITPAPGPRAQFLQKQAFYKWESVEIVTAFKENGMEVVDMKPAFTFEPILPRESTIFFISTSGENAGAFVSSYNTKEDLKNAKNYYAQMNRETLSWWIFEKDNILVLISGKVPEEKAKQYKKVLNEIDK